MSNREHDSPELGSKGAGSRRSGFRVAGRLPLPPPLIGPLREALDSPQGGEIIVRTADHLGRIYVTKGAIAWVVCDSVQYRLSDVLESTGLGREELRAAVEDCKRTGANFGETLLEWQLIDRESLRRSLLLHNAHHFLGFMRFDDEAQAFFVPQARAYSSELTFDIQELLDQVAKLAGSVPPTDGPAHVALEELSKDLPGVLVLAAVHIPTSGMLGAWPREASQSSEGLELGRAVGNLCGGTSMDRVAHAYGQLLEITDMTWPALIVLNADSELHLVVRSTVLDGVALYGACEIGANFGLTLSRMRRALGGLKW